MEKKRASHWSDFFRDARDTLSAFTIISLLAGLTLVTAPLVCRYIGWIILSHDEQIFLCTIYCISALSDALLGIYLNKAPDAVAVNQQFGEGAENKQQLGDVPLNPKTE